MRLLVVPSVDIGRQDVHAVVPGIEIGIRESVVVLLDAGGVGIPDPEQIVEPLACKILESIDPQALESLFPRLVAPPEPRPVHLVIGPPKDRNTGITQLEQVGDYRVHLPLPGRVEGRSGGAQGIPFLLGRALVHGPYLIAVAVVSIGVPRVAAVPHQRDDAALGPFPDGRIDNVLTRLGHRTSGLDAGSVERHGDIQRPGMLVPLVPFADVIETEIAAPDDRMLSGHREHLGVIPFQVAREIMLAAERILPADRVQE